MRAPPGSARSPAQRAEVTFVYSDLPVAGAKTVRACIYWLILLVVDPRWFELAWLLCYSLPVSSSVIPQVRHELALIAVGDLAVADILCR